MAASGYRWLGEGISDHEVGGAVDKTDGPLASDLFAEPVVAGVEVLHARIQPK